MSDELRDKIYDDVENFLFKDMFKQANTKPDGHVWAFPGDDSFNEIFGPNEIMAGAEFIDFTDEGVESKGNKLHWHINFRVYSYVPTYNQGVFRQRIQDFLDEHYPLPHVQYIKKSEYVQGIRDKRRGRWYVNLTGSWQALGKKKKGEPSKIPKTEMGGTNYINKVPRARKMLQVWENHREEFMANNQNISKHDGRDLLGESLNWACIVLNKPLLFPELEE